MKQTKPTYQQLEKRLAAAEPIVEALKRQEVDAVVGDGKIAFLLLRKVEEALLESNGEFSALFDLDGIGMIQADTPAFRFTRVNAKFCEISGYSAEELLTKTYIDFSHPDDRKNDLKELARVIRGKSDSWSIEKRCVRKDGGVIWVKVHGSALRDQTGRVVRIMAMIEDITARKQTEPTKPNTAARRKQPVQQPTADLSRMLRALRAQVVKGKPASDVLRALQKLMDAIIDPASARSTTVGRRGTPQKKTGIAPPPERRGNSLSQGHRARQAGSR